MSESCDETQILECEQAPSIPAPFDIWVDDAHEVRLLGKVVGEAAGWNFEYVMELVWYGFVRNSIGRAAFPAFTDGKDISINIETGEVKEWTQDSSYRTVIPTNWSIFNTAVQ